MNDNNTINNFKINFYNNLELAIQGHSEYMLNLARNTNEQEEDVEEDNIKIIQHINNQLKVILHRLHLQLLTLDHKEEWVKKEKVLYDKIKKQSLLNEEDTEEYLLLLNKFLFKEVGDINFNDVANKL